LCFFFVFLWVMVGVKGGGGLGFFLFFFGGGGGVESWSNMIGKEPNISEILIFH